MWRRVTRGLSFGSFIILFAASAHAQSLIGNLEYPADGATVSGYVRVAGFALARDQVARVDLYVDDQFQHSANLNLPRIDVAQTYPTWEGIQTINPGFETGFLAARFSNGPHTLHVVVVTEENEVFELGRRTVIIDNTINQAPFGWLEHPNLGPVFNASGVFTVSGWAADTDGIETVHIMIDNAQLQAATYGDPRPDVASVFPDFPSALFSGFVSFVDTTRMADGVHQLTVRATDRFGLRRIIGQRTIQVFNNTQNNLRPFGYLDEPLRDANLFGTGCRTQGPIQGGPQIPFDPLAHITPVRGWALDLGTREDTGRVSYVELLIDGVRWYSTDDCQWVDSLGAYVNCYGYPRFDVARYYPTFPDAPRAGFMFALDVGALMARGVPPGNHSLKIRVGDQEQTFAEIPNTAGIPVFFTCADDDNDFRSFGYIDFPTRFAYLGGTVMFHGWALDQNAGGVQAVQIWIDGVFAGIAQYGTTRTDVNAAYPFVANSFNSGWFFQFDTTQLANSEHRLTVRAIDAQGNTSEIGSVTFYTVNP